MRSFRFSALYIFVLMAAFLFSGCAREELPDYREHDYGYVQFKLYKKASYPGTKAAALDYLNDVAKLKVTLRYEDNLIAQTLVLTAADDAAAEFGLRSDKLKLLAGDYQVVTYSLYDKVDKVVYESTPEGAHTSFSIVAGGLCVHDLLADVVERGKVRFSLVKDFSDFTDAPEVKSATREYAFDDIKYVTLSVRSANTTTVFEKLPAEYSVHFNEEDDVEDGYQTSSFVCDTLLSLRGGQYTIESYSVFDSGRKLLEVNDDVEATFVVEDNQTTEAKVPVKLHESDEYIKDYYALYEIWKSLGGEDWYYVGQDHPYGCNWNFNKDIDLWGNQPGVNLHSNGRVAHINVSDFGFYGHLSPAIGQLTELVELYLGNHNDGNLSGYDPIVSDGNGTARRMERHSEEQLRLAKELRDKELEIQLEGLKQKIKNRSDYEKAVKLATEAYNKDIAALEDTYARKQAEKYINEYTYELTRGLREGSAEWYQALSKAEMKLWQQQSEMPKRKDETETEYKQRLDSYLKQANIYVDQMNQAYEKHVQTVNQIVLNSTRPLSNYYATQRDQLIKFWQDMRQLSTEDDAEFASRRNEVWKQVIDAQMNYQDAIKNEYKRFLDYQAALTYDGTSDINKDLKSNLKYYQDIWEDTLNDIQDYVSLNWTEIIPKLGMSVDEFDEAFGSPYGLQEIMDRMVNLGLVPDELIDQYIESLRNMADAEKEILDYRYDNWDNLAKGIADTMGGISDIYAIKLENEKKTLEKEGKYTEQERKNLEQRYKTVQTMQIAEATINTISGAVAAFMKCQELGQPWGAVLGAVQAAAVTAAGVAQIMKIKQTNPYSDTSSSLSSGGARTPYIREDRQQRFRWDTEAYHRGSFHLECRSHCW